MTPEEFFDVVDAMGLTRDQVFSCMKAYRDKGAESALTMAGKFKKKHDSAMKEWLGMPDGQDSLN